MTSEQQQVIELTTHVLGATTAYITAIVIFVFFIVLIFRFIMSLHEKTIQRNEFGEIISIRYIYKGLKNE